MNEIKFYIPFEGFYNSIYDDCIYSVVESEINEGYLTENQATFNVNYSKIHHAISEDIFDKIVELFNDEYDLFNCNTYFKYDGLSSPKYYNYSTDKIMAVCNKESYNIIYNEFIKNNDFLEWLSEASKSRSGFVSFYEGIEEVKKEPSIFLEYLFQWFTLVEYRDQVIQETTENISEIFYNNI